MPVRLSTHQAVHLKYLLSQFSAHQNPFTLELADFGCFSPKVIFIKVVPHPDLTTLQGELALLLKSNMNIFNANYQNRPFRPHVTIAFRDLRKAMFIKAWDYFKASVFHELVKIQSMSLLIHGGGRWRIEESYPFKEIAIK